MTALRSTLVRMLGRPGVSIIAGIALLAGVVVASTPAGAILVNPKITWAEPAPIVYGTPLSATQFDATASVPGTFAFAPTIGTVLSGGMHPLLATFTPTDTTDYNTLTAKTLQAVEKAPTTTTLSSTSPVSYGAEGDAGLSVSVSSSSGAIPTGRVAIRATSTSSTITTLCMIVLDGSGNGACTFKGTKLQPGSYSVQASYGATTDFAASSSASAPLVIGQAATTLSALAFQTPRNITFTATLTSQVTTSPVPNQHVVFTWGAQTCTAITKGTGVAKCTMPNTGDLGTSYTAAYAGSADYESSSETGMVIVIFGTTTTLTASPTAAYGAENAEVFAVTVTSPVGAPPATTVPISLPEVGGGLTLCTIMLSAQGTGSCALSSEQLDAGTYTVQATYESAFPSYSSSSTDMSLTVQPAATTLSLSPLAAPPGGDETMAATLTSQVTGGGVAGQLVKFTIPPDSCTATTDVTGLASCSVVPTGPAPTSYTSAYAGSTDYQASSGTIPITEYFLTTTTLTASPNVEYGAESTEVFSVTLTSPTGPPPVEKVPLSISEFGSAVTLCTVTLNAQGTGECSLSPTQLDAGTYTVTAFYEGLGIYLSSSVATSLTIQPAATTLTPVPPTLAPGDNAVIAATLTSQVTGAGVGGQYVVFTIGSDSCTGTTDATGLASCTVAMTSLTSLTSVPASYAGSLDYSSSTTTVSLSPIIVNPADLLAQSNLDTEMTTAKANYVTAQGYDSSVNVANALNEANPSLTAVGDGTSSTGQSVVSVGTFEADQQTEALGPSDGVIVVMAAWSPSTHECWFAEDNEEPWNKIPAAAIFLLGTAYGVVSMQNSSECSGTDAGTVFPPLVTLWQTGGFPLAG